MATTPGFIQLSSIIKAKSWSWVDAANPNTVQTRNGAIKAKSAILDTYVDTTSGLVGIINFERGIILKAKGSQTPFLSLGTDSSSQVQMGVNGTGSVTQLNAVMQIIPITAAFVTKNMTWTNTITTPIISTGSAMSLNIYNWMQSTIPARSATFTSDTFSLVNGGHKGITYALDPLTAATYGFLLQIKPHYASSGVTVQSILASLLTDTYPDYQSAPAIIPAF